MQVVVIDQRTLGVAGQSVERPVADGQDAARGSQDLVAAALDQGVVDVQEGGAALI